MKGFSELGVTLGAITNGRHLPTFENGDALAFPGTYQKKMFVRISVSLPLHLFKLDCHADISFTVAWLWKPDS